MSDQYNQIIKDYTSALKGYLRVRADANDVDDLIQEIFIKIHQNMDGLKDHDKLQSWLFTIARNTLFDYYRKNGKHQLSELDENSAIEEIEKDTVTDLEKCVEPFIKALPESESSLLNEIDLKGLSQKEYAKQHDLPYSTLKSRVKKSRENLKGLFENCCEFSTDSDGRIIDYHPKKGTKC